MADQLIPRREMQFQLYEVLNTQSLCEKARFEEHNVETFNAVIDMAEKMAEELFLPHNAIADKDEPTFDGKKVTMIGEVKKAFDTYRESGFIAGHFDYEDGGMQLPVTIMNACAGYFLAANPSTTAYPFLTAAAANVVKHFANEETKQAFLPKMLTGDFTGTMALTEPHAGSGLADIRTSATLNEDGTYRVKGSKLYISAGEHELSDNIVHLVLAKIPGGPAGVKGISLFVVPKYRLDEDGNPGPRNDVTLAGLIHKMGYRGTTSTALTFGENGDCHGYLVGEPHQGLRYMFMMMNEARIGVGYGAAMIGYRGYRYSLEYAKDRTQGRAAPKLAPEDEATPIINHGDVRRMLLAQKSYCEGGMALCLYGSTLIDALETEEDTAKRTEISQLLELLTPVFKAWPSEFGPKANDLAIQILGGAGYTREYPVEQCWRDNRLNPIHEGTNGIQALDLLGRKLWQSEGKGLQVLLARVSGDMKAATTPRAQVLAAKLKPYLDQLGGLIQQAAGDLRSDKQAVLLTNASCFLNVFSACVVSWIWLRQANVAEQALINGASGQDGDFYEGKMAAAEYFLNWELPLVKRDIEVITSQEPTCENVKASYF
ncbi:acyl-CoA dehydrogenase [Alteromonas stellipolaris]|uniref:acyl-CoA dehydrogenase n=1 Tax=Alteromonas stellipolaris TaxID=233316 RepID=UPI0026E26B12|nr:acyl-CoA dehydrogenase [Alteromonas stellipolaris]MDO6538019.1 acyl-CoA dehydrogenase [Alteromonas stellipolaris]MDP2535612.1 acyl-CoA dehydrogenase [Alteromonas stellipolaris]